MQPREKFKHKGVDALTNHDLISILLSTGSKDFDVYKTAKKVLRIIKAKDGLSYEKVKSIHGVGDVKAIRLIASVELGRRLYGERSAKIISTTDEAYNHFKYLADKKQEYLAAMYLNARYELLDTRTVAIGAVNKANIAIRDILIPALELNASNIVLAHNHPSGHLDESEQDIITTRRVKEACDLVGINLLEHIIIGKDGWKSVDISQTS
jgi:DNA repair protein RadC